MYKKTWNKVAYTGFLITERSVVVVSKKRNKKTISYILSALEDGGRVGTQEPDLDDRAAVGQSLG